MTFTFQQLDILVGQLNTHILQMTDGWQKARFCGCSTPLRVEQMHPTKRTAFAIFKHYSEDLGDNLFIVDGSTKMLVSSREELTELLKKHLKHKSSVEEEDKR